MKDKFMLSRGLVCSTRYLRLSPSAQALYIALNADADDDGIVDAFAVMLRQRAAENDLKQLVDSNFVVLLDSTNLLVWLRDWLAQNLNRDLRYLKASQYRPLLAHIIPDAQVVMVNHNAKGKKYRKIVSVSVALQSNTNQDDLLRRGLHTHKSSQDKYIINTCLDISNIYMCPVCHGKGSVNNILCSTCNGTGQIEYVKKEHTK